MTTITEVIERHKRQFVARFGEDVFEQTFVAALNFTGISADISERQSQAESDTYMEMVARMLLDIREANP